jgi:uncharacterized YigZ family protein
VASFSFNEIKNKSNFARMNSAEDTYRTIAGESQSVFRDKASKFLGIALPVTSEPEIKANLDQIRKRYFDANHHCYAYRLGFEKKLFRFNDDGEPGGSAGKPIYGQILSKDLTDLLIVVVRYFGGTKLGIPGLINAYKTSAREALDNAVIIEKNITVGFRLTFDYPAMNEIMRILKEERAHILSQGYDSGCSLDFEIRKGQSAVVQQRLGRMKKVNMQPHLPET